jgi:hypothetical protein
VGLEEIFGCDACGVDVDNALGNIVPGFKNLVKYSPVTGIPIET